MKTISLLFILFLPVRFLSAQKGFGECIMASLMNVDSTVNDTVYNSRNWKDCVMGKPVPDIELRTIGGKVYRMKDLAGKVVVLNFWFTQCIPCIEEMPSLNRLVKEYRDKDVVFFGITYDNVKTLRSGFLARYPFDFNIVSDSRSITEMFSAGYPTTYIIDRKGIVSAAWQGVQPEPGNSIYWKARPVIEELLK